MDKITPALAVLAAGLLVALQGPTNGWLAKTAGAPAFAVLVSFATGLLAAGAAALLISAKPQAGAVQELPWYAWLGGLYGVGVVFCTAWATPKLGAGPALVAALVAQTALGLALDHFAVMGLERSPVTWLKAGGLVVMLGGALMIAIKR